MPRDCWGIPEWIGWGLAHAVFGVEILWQVCRFLWFRVVFLWWCVRAYWIIAQIAMMTGESPGTIRARLERKAKWMAKEDDG